MPGPPQELFREGLEIFLSRKDENLYIKSVFFARSPLKGAREGGQSFFPLVTYNMFDPVLKIDFLHSLSTGAHARKP